MANGIGKWVRLLSWLSMFKRRIRSKLFNDYNVQYCQGRNRPNNGLGEEYERLQPYDNKAKKSILLIKDNEVIGKWLH
jgi:hypothetical protein